MKTYTPEQRYNFGFYRHIFGYFDWERVYRMVARNIEAPGHFVEIGCLFGKSALFLAEQLVKNGKPNVLIHCIDPWPIGKVVFGDPHGYSVNDVYGVFCANVEQSGFARQFNIIRMESPAARCFLGPGKLSGVFIDGDHDYEAVKQDIELYWPLVKQGGFFGGHDYAAQWQGVIRAVDEFREQHPDVRVELSKSTWFCYKP